jgi:hypothetical protein
MWISDLGIAARPRNVVLSFESSSFARLNVERSNDLPCPPGRRDACPTRGAFNEMPDRKGPVEVLSFEF